ncbi:unnamed protein product [Symbiodinium sp. CCMP2592]|nr:unnamed protein product [Symbiodinium sp. CCMP2592]
MAAPAALTVAQRGHLETRESKGKGKGKALKRALAAAAAEEAPGKKENVSQGLDSPPQSDISFLYLFAGESRRADLKSFLAAACEKAGLSFRYQEVDIGESAPDVLSDSFWLRLLNQVRRHEFNLLFMSPPYSTFNRATFVNRTGPPPLRNSDWPEGFPWLSGVWKSRAEAGTSLVRRVLSLATLATNEHVPWLIEHPEFLGATAAGTPASIWTWEEAVRVFQETRATSVTRLAGTWHGLRSVGVAGWPRLDPQQHYRGPLSRKCGHAHAPLIGTDENGHFLAGPAAYPSGFCEALASIAVLTFRQRVSSESMLGEEQARSSDTLENATSTAVVHQAEALALRLQHSAVSKESLLQIFDLLPGEELARDGVTWQEQMTIIIRPNLWARLCGVQKGNGGIALRLSPPVPETWPWKVQLQIQILAGRLDAVESFTGFPARRALPISKGGDNQSRKERVKALALWQALIVTSVCGLAVTLSKASDAQVPIVLDDVFARKAFSDGQMCFEEPELEKGEAHNILTLRLYGSKTSSLRRATRFRLIPVFAISPGVHGSECWATSYLENRAALGLRASEDEPLMRCPTSDGGFSGRKLRSSDASVWMREILSDVCTFEELANIATHSCKATCLAWLTKGAATNALCRRAGYHVGSEGKSELEYAHDAAAPLILRLANTLEMIKEGYFSPDEPRLQRWHGADYDSALALLRNGDEPKRIRAEKVSRLLADSSSDSESSEEPDDDSDSAESELDGQMAEMHAHSETLDSSSQDGYVYYLREARKTVHRARRFNDDDATTSAHTELGARPNVILNPPSSAKGAWRSACPAGPPWVGKVYASHDAALRRLHWEAWTLTAADLKRKVDGTDESAPRKLPVAEIGARLQVLTPNIAPLKLEGILEPSHASINLFAAMLDKGRLRYIEWSRLTTRDQEVVGASEDDLLKAWKPDKSGVVREHKDTPRLEANVATDLMVHHALRRRGVCYAIAELMTFEVHETLINFLFDAYYKDAPEGYQRVTLTQLSMCDREIHFRLSDQCRAGFTLGSDGGLPLDRHLPVVLQMRCVEQLLIPRTRGSAAPAVKTAAKTKPNPRKRKNGVVYPLMPWSTVVEAPPVAGFGVEAAVETSGSSVCLTSACEYFVLTLDLCFPGITLQQHAAEIFARRVLIARPPTRRDVEHLFDLLPLEEASRGTDVPSAFGSGCWARDDRFGLRRNNRLFPISVQLLNSFIRQVRPCHRWTSVVLFCDVQAPRHKDLHNSFDPNLVVAISDFSGGENFVVRPEGPVVVRDGDAVLRGTKLDPRVQPCLLHARTEEHLTLPWEGRRLVLVAFCIASVGELSTEQTEELELLGFRVRPPPESQPLPSVPPQGQLCLEIFSSPPGMSAAFRALQLRTLALHHSPERACSVPVMRWDVCKADDVNFCLQRLKEKAVALLFVMPPLSHSSKPGPLSAALEQFLILLLATVTAYPTPFCFCLPSSARCWKTVRAQAIGIPHHETPLDLCMFGAERKRSVILLHNVPPGAVLLRSGKLDAMTEMCDGFKVLGYAKPSGQFPIAFKHECSERPTVESRMKTKPSNKLPTAPGGCMVHYHYPKRILIGCSQMAGYPLESRRFGVQQGDKTRAIDDLRASMVNATCTFSEKILLQDIDVVAQTAKCFMDAVIRKKSPGNRQIVGRALDLKAAYKQLASSPLDAWASVLAVWDPSCKKHKYFRFSTLPFGAVHSVTSFNRVARALRLILLRIVKLIVFAMLGASFSLVRAPSGILEIANKKGRLESLRTLVNSVCAEGFVQPAVLASLKGRLLYASTHTFGRVALMAVKSLSKHLKGGGVLKLSSDDCVLLQHTIGLLEDMRPREIKTDASDRPVIVFTDGAHEEADGLTAHGGVLIDPVRGVHRFFGERIPTPFVDSWGAYGKRQLVGQAEVLPVLVAKIVWAEFLKGRKVLWFIDNESAKAALGSGSSPVLATFAMLCVGAHIDVSLEAAHWSLGLCDAHVSLVRAPGARMQMLGVCILTIVQLLMRTP